MLEIIGKGYVIEHCISFFKKENRQEAYQIYVTDLLMGIAKANGVEVRVRFHELINPNIVEDPEKESKTIINRIRSKLGG